MCKRRENSSNLYSESLSFFSINWILCLRPAFSSERLSISSFKKAVLYFSRSSISPRFSWFSSCKESYFYNSWLYCFYSLLYSLLIPLIYLLRSFRSFAKASIFCSNYYCFLEMIDWQLDWLTSLTWPSKESNTWFTDAYISSIKPATSSFYLPSFLETYPLIILVLDLSSFIFFCNPLEIRSSAESSNCKRIEFKRIKKSLIFYFISFSKSICSWQYLCTFVIAYLIIFLELNSATCFTLFLSFVLLTLWALE